MFELPENNIRLGMHAASKQNAIEMGAQALIQAGYVEPIYLQGMLEREQQTSTFLGNGIAIPHGTLATKTAVKKTGIFILQFPQGIDWGEGNTAYVVICIAARSDEHLDLLRQLTHILSDENRAQQLASLNDISAFHALLFAPHNAPSFEPQDLNLSVETQSLLTLIAINAGRLEQKSAVENCFVSEVISSPALYLENGLWLSDAAQGNLQNALAYSRAKQPFEHQGKMVHGVITLAAKDEGINSTVARLLDPQLQQWLLKGDQAQILAALKGESVANDCASLGQNIVIGTFTVRNEHGLHARPSAILVNTLKPFNAKITVQNLHRSDSPVNAKSVMKVVALGATKGQRLRFVAQGDDALNAIQTLGKAFVAGLGESLSAMILEQADSIEVQNSAAIPPQSAVKSNQISGDKYQEIEAVFIVPNAHGLHARPSKFLVNEVRKYNASIAVQNLDRNTALVSAKSLMKIVALGAEKGHRLRFIATGEQAQQAIDGIAAAIAAGLGE